jgi:hypothetical protein
MNEKLRAVERFRLNRPDLQYDFAGLFDSNPHLIKDGGIRAAGFINGLTNHKLNLYARGVAPEDIQRNIESMKNSLKSRKDVQNLVQLTRLLQQESSK